MRPSSAAGNTLSSGSRSALAIASGSGISSGSLHMFMIRSVPTFDGQQDQRVLEVDEAAFAVLHAALVEHLEEDLVHVGVRLLDLVEQHDAVRPAAHGLGQHAAFAVADVSRRRALERRDGVRLLELAHVDRDDVLLAAVERLGERERGLGLADAATARRA